MSMYANYHTSRPGTQPLVMLLCGAFWCSNRNHYILVLVMRALAMSIDVPTYVPKFNNKVHYYYLPRHHEDFFHRKYFLFWDEI